MKYIGTTTPLTGAATYNSASVNPALSNTDDRITGIAFSDQAGTLHVEQSGDGINWDLDVTYAVVANTGKSFSEEIVAPFVRLRYVNGATPQTVFRLHGRLSGAGVKP